jgi:cytidylate kinase
MPSLYDKFYNIDQRCIIAIDGTSASGKGTISKLIAEKFSFLHYQTSIFYRSLASEVLKRGIKDDEAKIIELSLAFNQEEGADLYSEDVTQMSSIVAAIPEVRKNLYRPQRIFLEQNKRVVMEGRDIGTVIAPDADLKLYITADLNIRAERRYKQFIASGKELAFEEVERSIKERDMRDCARIASPLLKAPDAIEIDTSGHSTEEILEQILHHIKSS